MKVAESRVEGLLDVDVAHIILFLGLCYSQHRAIRDSHDCTQRIRPFDSIPTP